MNTSIVPTSPDSMPPTPPSGVTATPASSSQVNLSWSPATDNQGVAGYSVERCLGAACANFAEVGTPSGTTFNNTGLAGSSTYRYRVRAVDLSGNLGAYSAIVSATTPAAPDTTAPSAPTGLSATLVGTTQVDLNWTAATDNVGVTEYRVERCQNAGCTSFAQVGTSGSTTFSNPGLTASTAYRFRVRAVDAAGNLGPYSNIVTATTPGAPDTTPPSAPTGLNATTVAFDRVDLGWTGSTDNVGVAAYRVERCIGTGCTGFAEIAAPTATTVSDTGVTTATTYRYRVRAADASANLSGYSNIIEVTTPSTPPAPTGLVGAWGFNEGVGLRDRRRVRQGQQRRAQRRVVDDAGPVRQRVAVQRQQHRAGAGFGVLERDDRDDAVGVDPPDGRSGWLADDHPARAARVLHQCEQRQRPVAAVGWRRLRSVRDLDERDDAEPGERVDARGDDLRRVDDPALRQRCAGCDGGGVRDDRDQ